MSVTYVGLDAHKKTIVSATAEDGRTGEVRSQGTIENTPTNVDKLIKRLAKSGHELHFCYEASCCGYGLHRQIVAAGYKCDVIAPSRIPSKPGDHIKTDRRDAMKLARLLRAGELDAIWIPDAAHEAMRDLIRSRHDAMKHLTATKQQLLSFLLRHGRIYTGKTTWTHRHYRWLADQKFDFPAQQIVFQDYINAVRDADKRHADLIKQIERLVPHWSLNLLVEALCLLKGVNLIVAATILSATGDLRRFATPMQLSAYLGSVPSEHSSGDNVKRGGITKAGNGEARRVLIQASWCYRFPARVTNGKEAKLSAADKALRDVAWRAQKRLCERYRALTAKGKKAPVACVAVARELATFIWEMGQLVPPVYSPC
ncbi:MAG: IS110 family transposase [Alphaproteobacteria bacterium]|nr:IS110 family transposase [Alphaproteobacteria bacterium]